MPLLLIGLAARPEGQEPASSAEEQLGHPEDSELRRHDTADLRGAEREGLLDELLPGGREGLRRLADAGIEWEAFLTTDSSRLVSGGAEPDSSASRALFDALVRLDTERVLGLPGGTLVFGVQAFGGKNGSRQVGVLQNTSSLDTEEDRVQFAHLWYEQALAGGRTRLRLGKMDANALFDAADTGAHFLHSAMALSPTILGLPTYPDSAYGVVWSQELHPACGLRLGLFDGAGQEGVTTGSRGPRTVFGKPADLFLVAEVEGSWGTEAARAGRLAIGSWRHTGDFERFDGGQDEGTQGTYLVLEQCLLRGEGNRSLDLFARWGHADPEVAPFDAHLSAGLVASDFCSPSWKDRIGLGFSAVRLSDEPGAGFDEEAEIAWDTFFAFELVPGLRLKPDLQLVLDPGGRADLRNAWILTLRATFELL